MIGVGGSCSDDEDDDDNDDEFMSERAMIYTTVPLLFFITVYRVYFSELDFQHAEVSGFADRSKKYEVLERMNGIESINHQSNLSPSLLRRTYVLGVHGNKDTMLPYDRKKETVVNISDHEKHATGTVPVCEAIVLTNGC